MHFVAFQIFFINANFIIFFSPHLLHLAQSNAGVVRKVVPEDTRTDAPLDSELEEIDLAENPDAGDVAATKESETEQPAEGKKDTVPKKKETEIKKEDKAPAKELLPKLKAELKKISDQKEEQPAAADASKVSENYVKEEQKSEEPKKVEKPKEEEKQLAKAAIAPTSTKNSAERLSQRNLFTILSSLVILLICSTF